MARANSKNEIMLTLVLKCETLPKKIDLSKFQEKLQKEFPEIASFYLNFNPTEGNRILELREFLKKYLIQTSGF